MIDNEEFQIIELPLSEVKNKNIKKDIGYKIYKRKMEGHYISTIWGDNFLMLTDNGINFSFVERRAFKYHREILGLKYEVIYYINEIKKFFKDKISIEYNYDDDDNDMIYSISITSNNTDVEKFINKMLEFEYEFDNKLKEIYSKIEKLIK